MGYEESVDSVEFMTPDDISELKINKKRRSTSQKHTQSMKMNIIFSRCYVEERQDMDYARVKKSFAR